MTIGVTNRFGQAARVGLPLTAALAASPTPQVFTSLGAVLLNKQPFLQGGNTVAPTQADPTTGYVAPPIAGGLTAAAQLLVVPGSEPVSEQQKKQNRQWT